MAHTQHVRIIGGRFRGKKLSFKAIDAIKPTPDRVRETLFNWLAPSIAGARCLDAFSGSGILGIEAISRGAAKVVFVDQSKAVIQHIRDHLTALDVQAQAQTMVGVMPHVAIEGGFDVVFLDPPYQQALLRPCLDWLQSKRMLHPDAMVYVECAHALEEVTWLAGWQVHRHMKAGAVHAYLLHEMA
jgi:16S rRNA (guanine966-N2)-methyltransferase